MSERYVIHGETLQSLVDSVKNQTGTTDKITISQMVDKIDNLQEEILRAFIENNTIKISCEDIEIIRKNSFYKNINLKDINFPLVKEIEHSAFYGCSSLTSVSFPSLTTIGSSAFCLCSSLSDVNMPLLKTIDNSGFNKSNLREAVFNLVTDAGQGAFRECKQLTTVLMPNLINLGSWSFYACTRLSKVDFGSVTSIGDNSFYSCSALKTLILRSNTMCTIPSVNVFKSMPIASGGTGYIYVPSSLVDTYKADSVWSTFATQIRAIEDYPDICGIN